MAQFYEKQAQLREEEQAKLMAEKEELEANLASISIDEDPDLIRDHQRLAEAQMKLKEDIAKLQRENEDLNLQILSLKKKLIGTLKVNVCQAKDLKKSLKYANMIDPFCTLQVETQNYRTRTCMGKTNPVYDQSFLFFISDPSAVLELKVMDWHLLLSPSTKGEVHVPLADLKPDQEVKQWYTLVKKMKSDKKENDKKESDKKESDKKEKKEHFGEIELSLLYSKSGIKK